MNYLYSSFHSNIDSLFLTLLMTGILFLHIPIAKRQSKQYQYILISLTAGLSLVFLTDLLFVFIPEIKNALSATIMPIIKLSLILSSSCFLVIFHVKLKTNFLDLEDKFLKVFNTSPHGMMIVKVSDATIKEVNTAFERVAGFSAEEVIGKTTLELGLWHQPQQRNEVISTLLNYQSFGPVEYKFIPKTGVPTKYLYTAQFIIIKGEKFLVAHIQEKYDKSLPGYETKNLLKQRLHDIMSNEALFKVPGLTLSDLAEKLETNKTYLSQAINSEYGNFNEYLNRFRVIEACRLIQNGLDPRLSIDHLYSEVGFSSRSSFYEAFKKFTGVSPSRFRQVNSKEALTKSKINS